MKFGHFIDNITFEKLKMASKVVHELLPTEIFVMILKKLGYKSLSNATLTCKKWKKFIDDFGLMKPALGKFVHSLKFNGTFTIETKYFQIRFHQ